MSRLCFRSAFVFFLLVTTFAELKAQDSSTTNYYRISLLRAAPGYLPGLVKTAGLTDKNQIVMRHSQGDHWDVMVLAKMDGPSPNNIPDFGDFADFQHDFVATSSASWEETHALAAEAEIFHIEMFQAARGQESALLREREMENTYLEETGRRGNQIYETLFGSDVDNFTIGYYKSMVDFATDPDLSDIEYQKAASTAGFKSRSDIGFELRKYIVGHQDTIATKVD